MIVEQSCIEISLFNRFINRSWWMQTLVSPLASEPQVNCHWCVGHGHQSYKSGSVFKLMSTLSLVWASGQCSGCSINLYQSNICQHGDETHECRFSIAQYSLKLLSTCRWLFTSGGVFQFRFGSSIIWLNLHHEHKVTSQYTHLQPQSSSASAIIFIPML